MVKGVWGMRFFPGDVPQSRPRVIGRVLFTVLLSLSLALVLVLGWAIIDETLNYYSSPLLVVSLCIALPMLCFAAVPIMIPGDLFIYRQEESRTVSVTSRFGGVLVALITAASIFLVAYGCEIIVTTSYLGVFYLAIGICGVVTTIYFIAKWSGKGRFGEMKVTLSKGHVSIFSLNTVIEFTDGNFEVGHKSSFPYPKVTISGVARVHSPKGTVAESRKSAVLSPINCGRVSMSWVLDTLTGEDGGARLV